jgi:hypothetical protein
MKNANFHTKDVKAICEKKLNIEFRSGKEYNGWFILDNKKIARITVAKGRKPIPRKTYKSMAQQLKLLVNQFDDLLECPINKEKYVEILRSKLR